MEHTIGPKKEKDLLIKMGDFAQKITQNHHLENLSEFVMHDLCAPELFALPKAAFLVNNPDFKCLKGLVGYHHPESFISDGSWLFQKDFIAHMKKASFNQQVRAIQESAVNSDYQDHPDAIHELAARLQIEQPLFHIWPLKHDNQGILIYQKPHEMGTHHDHLHRFVSMLSFCPIF